MREYLDQFSRLKQELGEAIRRQEEPPPTHLLYLDRLDVMEQQLLAAIEIARGETLAAARIAHEASRLEGAMPYSFGPPFVDWPAAEMLGELLLDGRRFAEAAEAFELQLQRTRLRSSSLHGLLRARQKLGQDAEAAYAAATLGAIWRRADRAVRAQVPGPSGSAEGGSPGSL